MQCLFLDVEEVRMIDINVSYGKWPFQPVGFESMEQLDKHLASHGIKHAFTTHMGALWNPDVDLFNLELLRESKGNKRIIPIPTINPAWPASFQWPDEERSLVGVRMCPSFHGYRLKDERVHEVVEHLITENIVLFIHMRVEDERMQHPKARVDGVEVGDILHLHDQFPKLKLVCLNAYLPEIRIIASQTSYIGFDTAFSEWMYTMECILDLLPPERIYLGTHTPFLYTQANLLKVTASRISEPLKTRIASINASHLLAHRLKR